MQTEIGIAELNYNESGIVESASFQPTMTVKSTSEILAGLNTIPTSNSCDSIQQSAEVMLATYFSKMNDIELSDREEYYIASEVESCVKYESGVVKQCRIKFVFRER